MALEAAEKALAVDSSLPLGHERMAWVLAWLGKLDEAVAAARDATRLDSNYASGHTTLAMMLAFSGDTVEIGRAHV